MGLLNNKPQFPGAQKVALDTIQKEHNLNTVYRLGGEGPGGAYHQYAIEQTDGLSLKIRFQCGPRNDPDSEVGILDPDLLEIVRDRLKCFQEGEYANDYNAQALEHVEAALKALNQRVIDRANRGVLGTDQK